MNYQQWTQLSAIDQYATIKAMRDYGGGFVKKLVDLYQVADAHNAERIVNAFPEIFEKYQPMNWRDV